MIWKNCGAVFTDYGGVAGGTPAEGGSGKAGGFVAWGKAFPLLCYSGVLGSWVSKPLAT